MKKLIILGAKDFGWITSRPTLNIAQKYLSINEDQKIRKVGIYSWGNLRLTF